MGRVHLNHGFLHLKGRAAAPVARPNVEPAIITKFLETTKTQLSNLSKRSDSSQCTEGDTSHQCQKPSAGSNVTVPIVLGIL